MADRPAEGVPIALIEQCAGLLPEDAELLADLGLAYDAAGRERTMPRPPTGGPSSAIPIMRMSTRALPRLLLRRQAAAEARAHVESALRLQPNRQELLDLLTEASRVVDGDSR